MKKPFFTFLILTVSVVLQAQNPNPEMVLVEGGTFKMGNNVDTYADEFPDHDVKVSSFYISRYEITLGEYLRFSRTAGLPAPSGDESLPATEVTWFDAVMYCNWLSQINGYERAYIIVRTEKNTVVKLVPQATGFRLPTEAEWEYAAKGGQKSAKFAYSGSNNAQEIAWFVSTGKMLHKPGLKAPNELGIYDMSGNCMEWCFDFYESSYYSQKVSDNPSGPENGIWRVCRGGNFSVTEESLRTSKRFYQTPDYKDVTLGFRVIRKAD